MQIPYGTFTQFRLAGEGVNDDNMMSDISSAGYSIRIEQTNVDSDDIAFDLFLFNNTDDYNCYVEAVSLFELRKSSLMKCDFLETKPYIIFEQVHEHQLGSDRFLS